MSEDGCISSIRQPLLSETCLPPKPAGQGGHRLEQPLLPIELAAHEVDTACAEDRFALAPGLRRISWHRPALPSAQNPAK